MSNTAHGVTIDAKPHQAADQYLDALITLDEFVQQIPRIKTKNAKPPLTAHPELSDAFTPQGIASLLVRVITIQQTFGRAAPSEWENAPSGDRMAGRAFSAARKCRTRWFPTTTLPGSCRPSPTTFPREASFVKEPSPRTSATWWS